MPRPRASSHGHKIRISVTVSPEIYEWVIAKTEKGAEFGSFSHAVERGLTLLREKVDRR